MRTTLPTILACSVLIGNLSISSSLALGNQVLNGGFESPPIGDLWLTLDAGSGFLNDWTITSGSIEMLQGYWQPSEGSQSLDLSGNESGRIEQTLATIPGRTYRLTFDISGNPDGEPTIKTLQAGFGAASQTFTFDTTGNSLADMRWSSRSWDIVATSATSILSFQNVGATPYGAAIDNVSVVVVPEPASLGALGLICCFYAAKRARKNCGPRSAR